jgi:hypothetical protein
MLLLQWVPAPAPADEELEYQGHPDIVVQEPVEPTQNLDNWGSYQ